MRHHAVRFLAAVWNRNGRNGLLDSVKLQCTALCLWDGGQKDLKPVKMIQRCIQLFRNPGAECPKEKLRAAWDNRRNFCLCEGNWKLMGNGETANNAKPTWLTKSNRIFLYKI